MVQGQKGHEDLKTIKINLIKELIKRNIDQTKQEKIIAFLTYYVNFKNPENMSKFEIELQQLTGRKNPMGIKKLILQWQKEDGIEIGIQRGEARGIEIGRQQGEARGIYQNSLAVAQELKKEGLAIDFIAKTTKLSIEEIEAL